MLRSGQGNEDDYWKRHEALARLYGSGFAKAVGRSWTCDESETGDVGGCSQAHRVRGAVVGPCP